MSVIRKGDAAKPGAGGSKKFVKIGDGDSVLLAPMVGLEGMISIDQHAIWIDGGSSPIFPCIKATEEQCPGCQLKNEPKYKAFLPVMTKEDGPKIFSFGISVARQLAEIEGETGSIKGVAVRVKRKGSGLQTKYTVVAMPTRVDVAGKDVPDIETELGPQTREGILELLARAGIKVPAPGEAPAPEAESDSEGEGGWETVA